MAEARSPQRQGRDQLVRVWDPLVRIGHWLLVAAFFVAYFTEDDLLTVHVWAGYIAGAIVVVRIVWGLVGSRYARFTDFVHSPREVLAYLRDLIRLSALRYIGHSPAGGAMIIALLLGLAASVGSGLVLYALEDGAGPLSPWIEQAGEATSGLGNNRDDDEGGRGRVHSESEELWEEIHELAVNLTLFLVILHVAGVLLASIVHRENLIRSMITGLKRGGD
jgi:cytochrome b